MHSYLHKNFILVKSGCYSAAMCTETTQARDDRAQHACVVHRCRATWALVGRRMGQLSRPRQALAL
jgi:hypothetical protein